MSSNSLLTSSYSDMAGDSVNNNVASSVLSMGDDLRENTIVYAAEILPDRFFFATLKSNIKLKSSANTHYFTIDDELVYENFNSDFGPLNLAMLFRYCLKVNSKLRSAALCRKRIIHYTSSDPQKRVNAAFLVGAYSILYLKHSPEEAYRNLVGPHAPSFIPFRDASFGSASFHITLLDVLCGLQKALENKFFDFTDFDCAEYEYYEKVEHADLNWILPEKFIAFCGPHNKTKVLNGYPLHAPEAYFNYYKKNNVKCIVRLNRHIYDAARFTNAGFEHKDLFFTDGSTPSDSIMNQFLELSEKMDGAIAVHCKAGLGRTGSLIGCFIMKHYRFTAREAIAWVRLCRPGSVIGMQQEWLEEKQAMLWKLGAEQSVPIQRSKFPLYSHKRRLVNSSNILSTSPDNVKSILAQVDSMRLEDADVNANEEATDDNDNAEVEDENDLTQGDMLNRIKAFRQHQIPFKGQNARKITPAEAPKAKEAVRLKRTAGPHSAAANTTKRPYRGSSNGDSGAARLLTLPKVTLPSGTDTSNELSLDPTPNPPEEPKPNPSVSCSRSSGFSIEVAPNRPITRSFSRLATPKEPHNPCPRTLRVKVRNPLTSDRVSLPPVPKFPFSKLPGSSIRSEALSPSQKLNANKTNQPQNLNTRVNTRSSARILNSVTNRKLKSYAALDNNVNNALLTSQECMSQPAAAVTSKGGAKGSTNA